MKLNTKKYLSLMLTASMVLGSFGGTTALAADPSATNYMTIADAFINKENGTTNGAAITANNAVTLTTPAAVKIGETENHTTIGVGATVEAAATPIQFKSTTDSSLKTIDFKDADVTVHTDGTTLTMDGGKIGSLTFEAAAANFLRAAAVQAADSNDVTISGGETGAITNANGEVTITGGAVKSVEAKTATISGGTVNDFVKATEKIEVSGTASVNSVDSPTVEVKSGTVDGVENVKNLTVASGATIKGIIKTVTSGDVVINIDGNAIIDYTTKIEIPSATSVSSSINLKIPTKLKVSGIPGTLEKVASDGTVTVEKATVEYYKKATDINPTMWTTYSRTSIIDDDKLKDNKFKLPTQILTTDGTIDVDTWYYYDTNGTTVKSAAGTQIDVTTLPKPIKMYAENLAKTTDFKFVYHDGISLITTPITVALTKNADGTVFFPEYTAAALKEDVKTPENKKFDGWVDFYNSTTTSTGNVGDVITDTTITYAPVFTDNDTTSVTYIDGTTPKQYDTPFAGGKITLPEYKTVFTDSTLTTFEGWIVSGSDTAIKQPDGKVDFVANMTITAKHKSDTPETMTFKFVYYTGTTPTTSGAMTVTLTAGEDNKIRFPEYTAVALEKDVKTPENHSFIGWGDSTVTSPIVIGNAGEEITDKTLIYTPVFTVGQAPIETTKSITYKDGATETLHMTPYNATTNKITLLEYKMVFPAGSDTFEGWTVSSSDTATKQPGDEVPFVVGMLITAKHTSGTPETTKSITYKDGATTKSFVTPYNATTKQITLPTYKEVFEKDPSAEFEGWTVSGVTYKADATVTYTAGMTVTAKYGEKVPTMDIKVYRMKNDTSTGNMKTVTVDITTDKDNNRTFKAPENTFTYSGKKFDSWETSFDKKYYAAGTSVTVPADFTGTIELYACWKSSSNSGGGGRSSRKTKYTITSSAGKGGSISPSEDVKITKGSSKTFKVTADEGYVIADVMVDGDSVGAVKSYTISDIKKDMTIKATFNTTDGEPADAEKPTETPTDKPEDKNGFTDVTGHWGQKYIDTVVEKGYFAGMTETTFGSDVAMTRAMFVTVLGRMSNVDTTKYTSSNFSDVTGDSWFGPYVNWAAQNGIVAGLTSTTFGSNDSITREQMAIILVNYAKSAGISLPTKNDAMMFTDNASISNWAKEAVSTVQKAGLLNGRTNGSFDPQGKATRAEVATVFVQLDGLK